jgi:hypothetical protein
MEGAKMGLCPVRHRASLEAKFTDGSASMRAKSKSRAGKWGRANAKATEEAEGGASRRVSFFFGDDENGCGLAGAPSPCCCCCADDDDDDEDDAPPVASPNPAVDPFSPPPPPLWRPLFLSLSPKNARLLANARCSLSQTFK